MPRKPPPPPQIIEQGGDSRASLEAAQAAALGELAQTIALLVHNRLRKGELIIVDGRVMPVEEESREQGVGGRE